MGITYIGKTDWRNSNTIFGIKDEDRLGHIYAVGKTGTGKSSLLLYMAISDIQRGNGLCIIDPHGDVAETILHYIPKSRIHDVIYMNAADIEFPIAYNPFHQIDKTQHNIVVSNLISTFSRIWSGSWGPRLEHILRFSLLSLLYYPKATLLDIQPLLTDTYFRNKVLMHISDVQILHFWKKEFDQYSPQLKAEAIAPILNKLGLLSASIPLRNIIGQVVSSFHIQEVLDNKKILICNLSKGIIGEDASAVFGSMILGGIKAAALFRARTLIEYRSPFYLYVDEMHSFVTLAFVDILSEARKYGLSLFLTHQYIEQLDEKIRMAVFGNVGTVISFRVGAIDAEYLAKEFYPTLKQDDFINLPGYSMYIKLRIDGSTSKPFSATTVPIPIIQNSHKNEVLASSRLKYGRKKEVVEDDIYSRYTYKPQNENSLFDTQ